MGRGLDPEQVPLESLTLDPGTKISAPKQSPHFLSTSKPERPSPRIAEVLKGTATPNPLPSPFWEAGVWGMNSMLWRNLRRRRVRSQEANQIHSERKGAPSLAPPTWNMASLLGQELKMSLLVLDSVSELVPSLQVHAVPFPHQYLLPRAHIAAEVNLLEHESDHAVPHFSSHCSY